MERVNSIEQYLRLFSLNASEINAGWSDALINLRRKAYEYLTRNRLPEVGDEGYEKTSLNDMFAPDLGVNIHNVDLIGAKIKQPCGVETFSSIKIFILNDVPVKIELPKGMTNLPAGLAIKQFNELDGEDEKNVMGFLSGLLDGSKVHAAQALNILLGNNGIFIKIEKGCHIDIPIQLINYSGSPLPLLSNRKVYIKVEKGARASIISCDHSVYSTSELVVSNVITAFALQDGGTLDYLEMEETNPTNRRFSGLNAELNGDSKLSIGSLTLMSGTTRNNFDVKFNGNNSSLKINGLVIGKNGSMTDNCTWVSHYHDHGHSEQLFKYALYDKSQGAFAGRITVEKSARFNEAYQNNKNVLLSQQARMYAKPQLLIYNDDVKCGHGATTGQLDSNAIYYMQTRGIPEEEARTMLIQAFMNDVVERMDCPVLTERLKHLVERRLKGEDILCGSCKLK